MTEKERASLQSFLLLALREAGELGMTEARLLVDARRELFAAVTVPELRAELRAFADRAWAIPFAPPMGDQRWSITALCKRALEEQGL